MISQTQAMAINNIVLRNRQQKQPFLVCEKIASSCLNSFSEFRDRQNQTQLVIQKHPPGLAGFVPFVPEELNHDNNQKLIRETIPSLSPKLNKALHTFPPVSGFLLHFKYR